jgi:hypothetical protein
VLWGPFNRAGVRYGESMGVWSRGGRAGRAARIAIALGLVGAAVGVAVLVGSREPSRIGRASPAAGSQPSSGWQRVEPGGRTLCGRGGRFAFWARMGTPDRLLVFFQGGGACWDYRSCVPGARLFDDRVAAADDPSLTGAGVLDLEDPRNPFREWSVLFVPSCSGDLYAGDATRTYRAGGGRAGGR